MYKKDFDRWNVKKRGLDSKELPRDFNFHEGEIWWMSFGTNIGSEIDGKNQHFERPGLITKIISRERMYVLPLTSKVRSDPYLIPIICNGKLNSAILSQARAISNKRLLRKIGAISKQELATIKREFRKIFI